MSPAPEPNSSLAGPSQSNPEKKNGHLLFIEDSNAKAAKRLRGYLIRLTREYTDGGMDSRAE
jgi:hypothetical protein